MALNISQVKGSLDILKTKDLRALNFYLLYLANYSLPGYQYAHQPIPHTSPINDATLLKIQIADFFTPTDERGQTLEKLDELNQKLNNFLLPTAHNLLPKNQFDWLKESEEACLYAFGYINFYAIPAYQNTPYRTYGEPSRHPELQQNIIDYFDYHSLRPGEFSSKLQMDQIKNNWLTAQKNTKIPRWLSTNQDDAGSWAWQYVQEFNNPSQSADKTDVHLPPPTIPIDNYTTMEKILAVITALRLWNPNPDTKTLFFTRMNRAWSQRKTRRSRENMKAINTYISTEAKKKLDSLVKYNRTRMNEMIETLIFEQYETQKKLIEDRHGK